MLRSFVAFWSWPLAQVANLYSSVHLASLPLGDSLLEDSGIGIPTVNWEIDFSVPSDSTEIKFQFALCIHGLRLDSGDSDRTYYNI